MSVDVAVIPDGLLRSLYTGGHGDLRMLSLPHPRTSLPSLFISYGSKLLEVQAINPPNSRSWFLADSVISDGKLLLMTPIDPSFLLLSLLHKLSQNELFSSQFRTADDILLEAHSLLSDEYSRLKNHNLNRCAQDIEYLFGLDCISKCLENICDFREFGDITVFRWSLPKIIQYLRQKVERLASTTNFEKFRTLTRGVAKLGLLEDGKDELLNSARLKAGVDVVSQYLTPHFRTELLESYNFERLNKYVLDEQQAEMQPMESSSAKKKKPVITGDDKKRKSKGSYGVENLKKANVTGMSKLTSFFKKA